MKETINPTSIHQIKKQKESQLKPELETLLDLFAENGYLTHKGTNSYVLANIIVDYTDRIIEEKLKANNSLNFWESNDIALVSLLAFERYRIYNTRSIAPQYKCRPNEINTPIQNGVYFTTDKVYSGLYQRLSINKSQWSKPINLRVPYADLLSYTHLKIGDMELFESFMTEDGVYIEQDYYVMPDLNGFAYLYLTDSYKAKSKPQDFIFSFLTTNNKEPQGLKINDGLEITCEYLRFVCSELFAKFRILNRMSSNQLRKFLSLKYNCDVLIDGNKIVAPNFLPLNDILKFSNDNVLLPMGFNEWVIKEAKPFKVNMLNPLDNTLNFKVVHNSDLFDILYYHLIQQCKGHKEIKVIDDYIKSIRTELTEDYYYYDFGDSL